MMFIICDSKYAKNDIGYIQIKILHFKIVSHLGCNILVRNVEISCNPFTITPKNL